MSETEWPQDEVADLKSEVTRLKGELDKSHLDLTRKEVTLQHTLNRLEAAEERVKELVSALDKCDCWCGVSESDGDRKLCARCEAIKSTHKAIGEVKG